MAELFTFVNKKVVRVVRTREQSAQRAALPLNLFRGSGDCFPLPVKLFDFMPSRLRSPHVWLLLLLLFGFACRFYGLNWDEGAALHPDERFCSGLVPQLSWPSSVGEWFDSAHSPMNPDNIKDQHYVYGQLPLFLGKWAAGTKTDIRDLLPLLRALSGLFDCLAVLFTVLIGRRVLGGAMGGLVAGALLSLAALNIQQSHFFTTDTFAATFLTLAFWNGARWLDTRRWWDALGLGLWFGCSLACKLSGLFFAVAWLGFVVLAWRRHGGRHALPLALGSFLVALWTFRVLDPMVFMGASGPLDVRLDPRFLQNVADGNWWERVRYAKWVGDFGQQLAITSGEADVPFDVQWIGRARWLFALSNLGWWGFGWPLLLAGIAGGALSVRRRPKSAPVLLVAALFALVSLGVQGAQFSKFTRYFLPLTPMFALLAAHFWRELLARRPKLRPLAGAALLYSFVWGTAVTAIYGRPHPRMEASRWIVAHVAPGTRVATETSWDEGLPISWVPPGDDPSKAMQAVQLESYDLDTPKKRAHIEETLNASDWIFISSGRSWQNIPRWPQKWPMMSAFYRALFAGELGFGKEQEFTDYPGFGPLRFPDGGLEEALSVYEHPRVLLFHKRPDYSPAQVARVLEAVPLPTEDQFHPNTAPGKWDSLPQP